MSGLYNQPVQYGRDSAHKSRAGWAVFSLGVYMTERQHIYEDLNESSSASPGGSQQLEIPPSPNSKRAANFFQICWYFTSRGDFNARQDSIVRLYFCRAPTFYKSANILCSRQYFGRRQHFVNPPTFSWDANILGIRQYFHETLTFWESANIFMRRQYFGIPPTFCESANNLWICLIFVTANICVYFQYLFVHLSMRQYFWCNCFNLRFKIDVVVMIIWSIVIIINSVLTLQVSTPSLPHDREPCEIKVVSNHTCSIHTCVCAGSRRVGVRLSGFRRQGISSTPGGFLKCPIPVWVCAEQLVTLFF
jgi:hypothetical protein